MKSKWRNWFVSAIAGGAMSIATMIAFLPGLGVASQGNNYLDTTGVFNGLTAANRVNAALNALLTCNSGSTAPTNALGGVPLLGQCWIDTTSATLPIKKRYSGSAWLVEGVLDVSNGVWVPIVGGGTATIASSATTNLCASPQSLVTVSGTTTITSLGSSCVPGQQKVVVFSGALTLTHNGTSLIIPGAVNRTTAAGDSMIVTYLGSGNWRVLSYSPLVGASVTSISGNAGAFTLSHGLTNSTNDLQIDVGALANHLSGLELSTAGSSSTFAVAAGAATDSTNADFIKLTSAISKTTGSWAVGSTNGALDTGSIANAWYHTFLIKRPDTGVVDVCISTSTTGCAAGVGNIPAAYTLKRRIGSLRANGSFQWLPFTQVGDQFIWASPVADVSGISSTSSRVATALSVPTGVVVTALFRGTLTLTASATLITIFPALIETDTSVSTGQGDLHVISNGTTAGSQAGSFARLTNTSAQIGVRSNTGSGSAVVYITTFGWIDARGK